MSTITRTLTIKSLTCGHCGILFGLESAFMAARLDDGQLFYCPNGHRIGWKAANERQRTEKRLEDAEARNLALRDQLAAAIRDAEAARTALLRDRARFAAGVCPCCNRSFENVRRHMQTQHPDYDATRINKHAPEFSCSCGEKFTTYRGLRIHQGRQRVISAKYGEAWDDPQQDDYWAHLTVVPS